jgi:hypothetical protein
MPTRQHSRRGGQQYCKDGYHPVQVGEEYKDGKYYAGEPTHSYCFLLARYDIFEREVHQFAQAGLGPLLHRLAVPRQYCRQARRPQGRVLGRPLHRDRP